jgi:hypothetical protein
VIAQLGGSTTADALAAVTGATSIIGTCAIAIWAALAFIGLMFVLRTGKPAQDQTWGCGYAAPTVRMQYTGRSFSEMLAERLLPAPLRPRITARAPEAIFPHEGELTSDTVDPFTRGVYQPFLARWADRFARLRWLQQGILHVYILYILVVLVIALGWTSVRGWLGL